MQRFVQHHVLFNPQISRISLIILTQRRKGAKRTEAKGGPEPLMNTDKHRWRTSDAGRWRCLMR